MIKIIDYKAGNSPSVLRTVKHLGYAAKLVSTPEELSGASHIILPGVGSAGTTMESLSELNLISALEKAVLEDKIPFLGVCVGMQILFEHSEEENADCLGWLKGNVRRFNPADVRVPQMGWNKVGFIKSCGITTDSDYFYFVNSYHVMPENHDDIWGESNYGGVFTAAVNHENIYGTQFHTEKSGEAGLCLLNSFLSLVQGTKAC